MPTARFDADALVQEFGDESLIAELAHLLLSHVDDQLGAVHAAVASQNASALKSAAHKIKGGMGTFGATPVVTLAVTLEAMGRDGHLDDAAAVAAQLDQEVRALCDDARSWLASRAV
jgi:protein-histidine pros-kinase